MAKPKRIKILGKYYKLRFVPNLGEDLGQCDYPNETCKTIRIKQGQPVKEEFSTLIHEGNTPQKSAFLSAFFTLVGTHGLHIISGLLWLGIMLIYMIRRGLTESATRKLTLLSIFWHLLDVVWIFIFTVVYLMGALKV